MAQSDADLALLMRQHAQSFTDIERVGLRTWFDLDQGGHDVDADRFLNAWLQFEHYTSLLPSDPTLRTPAMFSVQLELQLAANNELGIAQGILAADAAKRQSMTQPVIITQGTHNG